MSPSPHHLHRLHHVALITHCPHHMLPIATHCPRPHCVALATSPPSRHPVASPSSCIIPLPHATLHCVALIMLPPSCRPCHVSPHRHVSPSPSSCCPVSPMRGDTTQSRLYIGVFRPVTRREYRLKAPSQQDRQKASRIGSLGQETQLGVLGTPRSTLYTYGRTNESK